MKTIGLLGGLSWESSAHYYAIANERVRDRLGGLHSARCVMYSFDFDEIAALQHAGRWDDSAARMVEAARALERAGADFVVICSNTMHRMADEVRAGIGVPLLHIADPTAAALKAAGVTRVGLLATRFTMEQEFYVGRLRGQGLDVLVPDAADRTVVHTVIYDELVRGVVRDESRQAYRDVIGRLVDRGAAGVVLGCTEIDMLIGPPDSPVPLFDTTRLHAEAAVELALV